MKEDYTEANEGNQEMMPRSKDSYNFGFWDDFTLTPALSHRMGEGESCAVRLRIQPLWELQTTSLAVPSPVGRERVRVRVNLFESRLLLGNYFCTHPNLFVAIVIFCKESFYCSLQPD